jgi:alpha-ribazole phosphatase
MFCNFVVEKLSTMEVILIRHTTPDVPTGTCYGQSDVPLKETFEEEAAVTKAALEACGPVDRAYTSPLSRCTRLAAFCGYADAIRDPRLMELDFGEWEMKHFDDISDPRLQEWFADHINTPVTGGESFMMQYQRVSRFLDELRQVPANRVVIFAHGGVLVAAQIYAGLVTAEQGFSALTSFGGLIRINL